MHLGFPKLAGFKAKYLQWPLTILVKLSIVSLKISRKIFGQRNFFGREHRLKILPSERQF